MSYTECGDSGDKPATSKIEIIKELAEIRRTCGVSLSILGRISGVDRTTIYGWEFRGGHPKLLNLEAVCNALGHEIKLVKKT